jgi:hypothetical protein
MYDARLEILQSKEVYYSGDQIKESEMVRYGKGEVQIVCWWGKPDCMEQLCSH